MTSDNQRLPDSDSGRAVRAFNRDVMAGWFPDDQSDSPLFLQLAWFLVNLIIEGKLEEGGLMPSETTLAKQFGMSRMTARRAVESLRDIGVVSRSRRGTRIDVSPDEAVSLSGQFHQLLYNQQIVDSENSPLQINRRLDYSSREPSPDVRRRPRLGKEELLSRSRRLAQSINVSAPEPMASMQLSSEPPDTTEQPLASMSMEEAPPEGDRSLSSARLRPVAADIRELEQTVDISLAAVGVGRFGQEVVAHLVADLVEEGRSSFSDRPIPGLRVIGVDSDNAPFLQNRSPIQLAFRSLGKIASRMHLGPDVNIVSTASRSLTLTEEFKGLELCFLVSGLSDAENRDYLPNLLKALESQGTKTVALLSLPEEWESEETVAAADECLRQILATSASVIAVPLSSIGIPGDDLTWEDHLQETVEYFSSGFETLIRASSWIEGTSHLTLSDLYLVLSPGHKGALGVSKISGIGRSDRVDQLLSEGTGRLRRQGVDLSSASQVVAILSGARSFTRSEVRGLNVELQNMCGRGARIFFGTSMLNVPTDEIHLTHIA